VGNLLQQALYLDGVCQVGDDADFIIATKK